MLQCMSLHVARDRSGREGGESLEQCPASDRLTSRQQPATASDLMSGERRGGPGQGAENFEMSSIHTLQRPRAVIKDLRCLPVCLSACLSACLSVCLSAALSVSAALSACLPLLPDILGSLTTADMCVRCQRRSLLSARCFVGGMADMCYIHMLLQTRLPTGDSSLCDPHTGTQGRGGGGGACPRHRGDTAGGDMQMQNADLAAAESAGLFHVCSHKAIIKSAFYNFLMIL
jgi:hypothetical protein